MLKTRVIPALLLESDALVKTKKFSNSYYIGDPVNTVRIFNELEVDELAFLDITATNEKRSPNLDILAQIANECFMPLSYGGGLNNFATVQAVFNIGFEKIILNSITHSNPEFITDVSEHYGRQSVVASMDVKKTFFGKYEVWSHSGTVNTKKDPTSWALKLQDYGAGELLLTCINREGTWEGYDVELVKKITSVLDIPVIAHGGAGNLNDISEVVHKGKASAVAVGSMVVFQKKGMGVLINFPDRNELEELLHN